MYEPSNTPETAGRLYKILHRFSSTPDGQTDAMRMVQLVAGMLVETCMVFDDADEAASATLEKLCAELESAPNAGKLGFKALPPSCTIDQETEKGRAIARELFEDWTECCFTFHKSMIASVQSIFIIWEREGGFRRADMLRLLSECMYRCLAFEIAAQELCDVIIEQKIRGQNWRLADGITALSASAGYRLASTEEACFLFRTMQFPEDLDNIVYTMTQEAVRLGVPAGSDWRFGLAANDVPITAPFDIITELDPILDSFFNAIKMTDGADQAVACAKAAGRMLAVSSGGEMPEIEPAIAKPLAMAAITDTYKSVCMERQIAVY
jgi:hypothetical protein